MVFWYVYIYSGSHQPLILGNMNHDDSGPASEKLLVRIRATLRIYYLQPLSYIYIYTIRVHRCMTILSHSRSHVSGVVNRGEKEVPGKHKENTGSSWGLHAVWVEQACCSPALSAMSAADANAAAAAAPPAAADRVAVLKEERKTLKRQLAAATKELQNQESACKCMDTVSFRECRWDMWTLSPCWKTCTP